MIKETYTNSTHLSGMIYINKLLSNIKYSGPETHDTKPSVIGYLNAGCLF